MKKELNSPQVNRLSAPDADIAHKAVALMSEITGRIIAAPNGYDFGIEESLGLAGRLLSASRAYVMQDEKDGRYLRNTHEWVDEKIGPSMFSWPLYDYEYDLPSLRELFEASQILHGNSMDFPVDMRAVLEKQNVRSIMIVPLLRDGARIGLVGIDFCDRECEFTETHGLVLRFLASMVAIALERKHFQTLRIKVNTIRRALADVDPILSDMGEQEPQDSRPSKPVTLLDAERRIIIETLELHNGNKLKTAKHLGLTWPSLDRRCKKLGIEVKRK